MLREVSGVKIVDGVFSLKRLSGAVREECKIKMTDEDCLRPSSLLFVGYLSY